MHAKIVAGANASGTEEKSAGYGRHAAVLDDVDELMHVHDVCAAPDEDGVASSTTTRRLETHIWHAKRFEMEQRWGYVLPKQRPGRGRGWRAALKGARDATVVHDASYHSAFVVRGGEGNVVDFLIKIFEGEERSLFSKAAIRGNIAVDVMLRFCGEEKGESSPDSRRVIAPAMVLWRPTRDGEGSGGVREVLIWTHPAAASEARDALQAAAAASTSVSVHVAAGICRLEIVGRTAATVLSTLVSSGAAREWIRAPIATGPRGVMRASTRGDPREAAWTARRAASEAEGDNDLRGDDRGGAEGDERDVWDAIQTGTEVLGSLSAPWSAAELAARRRARRTGGDVAPAPCSPLAIIRRAAASDGNRARDVGFTVVAPCGWALPLWLALIHLGAHAAGRLEWSWLAVAAGAPQFPDDFPDTACAAGGETELDQARVSLADVVPRGKRTVVSSAAEWHVTSFGSARVLRHAREAAAALMGGTGDKGGIIQRATGKQSDLQQQPQRFGRRQRGRAGAILRWRPLGSSTAVPIGLPEPRPDLTWVRVLVRCPWGGGPVAGAPVFIPTAAQEAAWNTNSAGSGTRQGEGTSQRRRRGGNVASGSLARDVDSQEAIGFVTSASPPGAAVGVASAMVTTAALRRLRSRRFHPGSKPSGGGGEKKIFAVLRVPSASPAAVVPAVLTVALEKTASDAAWW